MNAAVGKRSGPDMVALVGARRSATTADLGTFLLQETAASVTRRSCRQGRALLNEGR